MIKINFLGLILGLSVVKLIELMFMFTSQLKMAFEKHSKPIVSSIKVGRCRKFFVLSEDLFVWNLGSEYFRFCGFSPRNSLNPEFMASSFSGSNIITLYKKY